MPAKAGFLIGGTDTGVGVSNETLIEMLLEVDLRPFDLSIARRERRTPL